jgi:predicted enzyme related to lactoylglutathione lyase
MPTRDTAPLGAPCWIDLYTSDPDASTAFYNELFGWTAETAGPEYGGYFNFSLGAQQVAGGMKNSGEGGMPDMWSVYLASADAAATADAAAKHGGGVIVGGMQILELGTMAVLADTGGASIGVWQPGLHKGFGVLAEVGAPAWFELHTRAYDASVAFYRDVFGWDTHVAADEADFRYTTLGEGEGQLAGIMDATAFLPEGVPAHWSIYFAVADADATIAKAIDLGGSVIVPPMDTPYGRLATLADPTGAVFKITAG